MNHGQPAADAATNMPSAELLQAGSSGTALALDTAREASTIPRTGADAPAPTWLYPSPRMFYNALQRKGFETDPADIATMVTVHNQLNEAVWQEVVAWEAPHRAAGCPGPTLKRFTGRPADLSPRAWLYHRVYGGPRPFDRHDWVVERCGGVEVRYVIDYYGGSAADEFHADVRPALDSPRALLDRLRRLFQRA